MTSAGATIHEIFDQRAAQTPRHPALVQGENSLSYAELRERSDELARFLLEQGVGLEECVGVRTERSIAMVVALLGILKAGGCYVPLESGLPAARARAICRDTNLRLVLCDRTPHAAGGEYAIDEVSKPGRAPARALPALRRDHLAYVLYTSGSTGTPKGVMIEHKSVVRLVKDNDYVPLDPGDRLLLTSAIGFDATTFELWGALLNGLTLYLADGQTLTQGPLLEAAIERHAITTMFLPTSLCARLAREDAARFRRLKYLLIGGEVLSPAAANAIVRACPETRLINVYGPTENTTFSTSFPVEREHAAGIPIGRPIRHTTACVVDEQGNAVPDGTIGELVLGGDGVARGYLNQPELTRRCFVLSKDGERRYKTGDFARVLPDGNLEFIGRRDQQIKVGGYRIELGEIEQTLAAIPGVAGAAVKAWERDHEKFVAAYYAADGAGLEPAAVRERLASTLPDYLLPAFCLRLAALPLDRNGKIDRSALPDPFAASGAPGAEPATQAEVERKVQAVWESVLGRERPDLDADFYDLGGSSIKAIRLLGSLTAADLDVTLSDILHHRTIRKLSSYIAATQQRRDVANQEESGAAGSALRFKVYHVVERGRDVEDLIAAYAEDAAASSEELLARAASAAYGGATAPHFVTTRRPSEDRAAARVTEEQLRRALGLRDARTLDVAALRERVLLDYQSNQRALVDGVAVCEYPMSPIQELQFSFQTPPSRGCFVLDRPVDLPTLLGAFTRTLREQQSLRSIPIAKGGRHHWRELDQCAERMRPTVLDLSAYYVPPQDLGKIAQDLLAALDFAGKALLYHVVVVKRNAREHLVLLAFHHVLFDRVSEEAFKRRLLVNYGALLEGGEPAAERAQRFSEYVARVHEGPIEASEQQLIEQFRLAEFFAAKRALLASPRAKPVDQSYAFQVAVPCSEHVESELSLGYALALYVKSVGALYAVDRVPLLFIYDGRRYGNRDYYDLVGECIDYVPLLLEVAADPAELQDAVDARLAAARRHNVNFLNLLGNDRFFGRYGRARELIDPGERYRNIDVCMFNYLGNRLEHESYRANYDARVAIGPNPLPLHSLLNCITAGYADGFVFNLRSSYDTDAPRLRELFAAQAKALFQPRMA